MKLHSLEIKGFRRHFQSKVYFSDTTFIIGENNLGKSSVLAALEYLLNDKGISENEFFRVHNSQGEDERLVDKVELTAEFRNVPEEAKQWRGFKGRVLQCEVSEDSTETGLRVVYRKTYDLSGKCAVELRQNVREPKEEYTGCKTVAEYIQAGLSEESLREALGDEVDYDKRLTSKEQANIKNLDDYWNIDDTQEEWFLNPGGIPGNVLCRLPKFLLIPAQDKRDELTGTSGTLTKTLTELFNDVREGSENYRQAQMYLDRLAQELDPEDRNSELGKMIADLNRVLGDIFPEARITAMATLSDPKKAIKPDFGVNMTSNITTSVEFQGTGTIRAAVFALLRYRSIRENSASGVDGVRPLIVGFEEPEIYLHPNAAHQMRNTIYDLASSEQNQIVCTTHSPYMIDLSRKPSQVLNNMCIKEFNIDGISFESIDVIPFNTSKAFVELHEDDKRYVKMLLKMDDYMAKVFFARSVLIVEGDTERIVLRETFQRMPKSVRDHVAKKWEVVEARGKATIISLVKYLQAMGIKPIVLHDRDQDNGRAQAFNQPIVEAIGEVSRRIMLEECIENVLGYPVPSKDKPFTAYCWISEHWGEKWESVPESWRKILEDIFRDSFPGHAEQTLSNELVATTAEGTGE